MRTRAVHSDINHNVIISVETVHEVYMYHTCVIQASVSLRLLCTSDNRQTSTYTYTGALEGGRTCNEIYGNWWTLVFTRKTVSLSQIPWNLPILHK